jgi:hypothetical protein
LPDISTEVLAIASTSGGIKLRVATERESSGVPLTNRTIAPLPPRQLSSRSISRVAYELTFGQLLNNPILDEIHA